MRKYFCSSIIYLKKSTNFTIFSHLERRCFMKHKFLYRVMALLLVFCMVIGITGNMQFVFANSSREIATSANSWVSTTEWFYQQLTDTSAKELYQEMAKPENWFTGVYTGKKVLCQETYATEDEAADKVGAIAKGLVWAVRHDQPEIFWLN